MEPCLRLEPDAWSEVLTLLVTGPVRAGSRPGPPAQHPSSLVRPCGVCPWGSLGRNSSKHSKEPHALTSVSLNLERVQDSMGSRRQRAEDVGSREVPGPKDKPGGGVEGAPHGDTWFSDVHC